MKYQIFKQKSSEMKGQNLRIREAKQGFLFFAFSTLLIALQFGLYITDSSILELMDLEGWLFFITSCISHAAMFALIPYLLSLIFTFCRCTKTARVVQIVGVVLLCIINYLNSQVYAIYHFHINGFVLSMVFGEGAGEIFNFDIMLYLKEIALFLVVAAIVVGVWYASYLLWKKRQKAYTWLIAGSIIGCTLFAHLCHIYGAFYQQPSVMKSSALLPYYFPTTSNGLLLKLGCTPPRESMIQMNGKQSADIQYPIQPLQKEKMTPDSLPNIIFILIDSWNTRSLTAECMPNAYQFAQQNQWFSNHVSGSNGTRSGVFSLFFGLSCFSTQPISNRSSSSACRNWATRYRPILVPPLLTRHSGESSLAGCQASIPRRKAILRWSEIQGLQRNSSAIRSSTRRARSHSSHSCSSTCLIALDYLPTRTSVSSRLGRMLTIPNSATIWIQLLTGICIATAAIRTTCCWAESSRP